MNEKKATPEVGSVVVDTDHGTGEVTKIVQDDSTGDLHARVEFNDGVSVWLHVDEFEQVFTVDVEDD